MAAACGPSPSSDSKAAAAEASADPPQLRVAFIGDSTLDNVVWVTADTSVKVVLQGLLRRRVPDAAVVNLAADGFTTSDVLNGGQAVISKRAREEAGDPIPYASGTLFSPLEQLVCLSPPATHAVLSCGGNDVRVILGSIHLLPTVLPQLATNYSTILEVLCGITRKLVLLTQYKPCAVEGADNYGVYRAMSALPGPGSPMDKLEALMAAVYGPIFKQAAAAKLPIIDLSLTFDAHDESLYKCQIEPSHEGGTIIANLVAHVLRVHDFSGPSIRYWLPHKHLTDAHATDSTGVFECSFVQTAVNTG